MGIKARLFVSKKFKSAVMPFSIAVLSTIFFTWPLILKLNTFFKDFGDQPFISWLMWYNQLSLYTGRIFNQQQYFQAPQFYPLPYSLAFSDHEFVPSLIFAPIFWLTNNLVLSTNFFILICFIFSFLSAYYSIRYFIKHNYSLIFASLIYTFNPLTFEHLLVGHLQNLAKFFLLPLFVFVYKYFTNPTYKNILLFSLFFTLNALTSSYFQIYSLVGIVFFIIPILLIKIRIHPIQYLLTIIRTLPAAIPFIIIIFYFDWPYLQFSSQEFVKRTISENTFYSASLMDWITPTPNNLIYGQFTREYGQFRLPKEPDGQFHFDEHVLYLGIIPMILSILGVIYLLKDKNFGNKSILIFKCFGVLLTLSFIMTFGPFYVDWNNLKGELLPGYFLYAFTPILNGVRVPTRFQFIFYVPFSLFAAYGLSYLYQLLKHIRPTKTLLISFSMLILVMWLFENIYLWDFNQTSSVLSEVRYFKTKNPLLFSSLKNKATLHLPVFYPTKSFDHNASYLIWSTVTEETILNGYSGYFSYDWYYLMLDLDRGLDDKILDKLKAIGLGYIIIHKHIADSAKATRLNEIIVTDPLQKIKSYEDKNMIVLDLTKWRNVNICDESYNADFSLQSDTAFLSWNDPFYSSLFTNHKNCFFISIGKFRYKSTELNLNNRHYSGYIRLPIVLGPNEQATLSAKLKIN